MLKSLTINKRKTTYYEFKPNSESIPHLASHTSYLLMLHGWGGSKDSFASLGPALAEKLQTTVIIPDLPGFGDSDPPPAGGWTTVEYAEWLEHFLNKVKEKREKREKKVAPLIKGEATDTPAEQEAGGLINKSRNSKIPDQVRDDSILLYGHSFGCRVIIRFLSAHPNWNTPVILTGAAGIKLPLSAKQRLTKSAAKVLKPVKKILPNRVQKLILGKLLGARDWAEVAPALKNTLRQVLEEEDLRKYLKNIKAKTLLLWGKNDTYTPLASARIFERNLPETKLVVFDSGKHGIHYTHETEICGEILKLMKNEKRKIKNGS